MDAIPIWALFVGTILLVSIFIDAGFRVGSWIRKRTPDEKESAVSAISGAILGLAAFMLAFTFGIVAERWDAKRGLVRDDANAIRTAWKRSEFLPEPDRSEASELLRSYVDLRLGLAQSSDLSRMREAQAESKRVQDRLWDMAVVNARKDMNSDVAALFVESLNNVEEVNATRIAVAVQARVPLEIWFVLYGITILGMFGLGYQTAIAESKRSRVQPILALSFALVIALIAALDRPDSGVMKIDQRPLLDVRDAMAAGERQGT